MNGRKNTIFRPLTIGFAILYRSRKETFKVLFELWVKIINRCNIVSNQLDIS